jgi:hypothetical protein
LAGAKGPADSGESAGDQEEVSLHGWDVSRRDYWVDPRGFVRYAVRVPRAAAALDMTTGQLREKLRNGTFLGHKDEDEEWIVMVREINRRMRIGDNLETIKPPGKAERAKEGARA